MNLTEVRVGARRPELERERLVGIENGRRKLLFGAHDIVRDVVPIRPGNRGPDWNGQ